MLALMVYGCILVGQQFATLTWLKSMLPLAVPFWADPYLASFDRMLFLGNDPWRLLHPLPKVAEELVDAVYLSWFPIKAYTLVALLALPPNRIKSRALMAYFLTIGLFGVLGQYALSSAGPIFYGKLGLGNEFDDLHMTAAVLTERDYLWSVYLNRHVSFGAGISAMPSVHVALSCWLALTLRSIWPRLAVVGWSFFATIVFGSIYLGWHYAADGIAGTACALAAWKLSKLALESNWRLSFRRVYAPQV
jgi:membrane-associated phospholipid phosphatase